MSRITRRAPTDEEVKAIQRKLLGSRLQLLGFVVVVAFLLPGFLFTLCGTAIVAWSDPRQAHAGAIVGFTTAVIIFLAALLLAFRDDTLRRFKILKGKHLWQIEEIHVISPQIVRIISPYFVQHQTLVVQLDDQQLLYLSGTCLTNPATYGTTLRQTKTTYQTFNGLPAPYSFPSTQFSVTRLIPTGDVLGIHVVGNYLAPEASILLNASQYPHRDSEILNGDWANIEQILTEHFSQNDGSDD